MATENVLTRKLGPLQTWQYLGIITVGGLGWYAVTLRKQAKTTATKDSTQSTSLSSTQTPSSYSSREIPDFIIYNQMPGGAPVTAPAPTAAATASAPGGLKNLLSHVFPGTTNLTWSLGSGTTTSVKITATPVDRNWGPVETVVPVEGMAAGTNTGHLFTVDQVSRGVTYDYEITPYNGSTPGPSSTVRVKND